MTSPGSWQAPLFASEHTRTVFVVDLGCLSYGRGRQLTLAVMSDLSPLPQRCTVCGGSVLAADSSTRIVRYDGPIDWHEGLPKRGRPFAPPRALEGGSS